MKKQICLLIRARKVQEIVNQHYEKERRDRCYRSIWEHYIKDEFQINYHTFLRYVHTDTSDLEKLIRERNLRQSQGKNRPSGVRKEAPDVVRTEEHELEVEEELA